MSTKTGPGIIPVTPPLRRRSPYRLHAPAYISLSGGRTSGYLLHEVLQHHDGALPTYIKVLFANTGREYEETLIFVDNIERHWGVKIHWVEYRRDPEKPVVQWRGKQAIIGCHSYREVTFETANRTGQPFEDLIDVKAAFRREAKEMDPVLPNPPQRFCSADLKARTMRRFIEEVVGWDSYTVAVGLRAEERSRVASLKAQSTLDLDYVCPLYDAGVVEQDVLDFWKGQPFDLGLKHDPELGTYQGNCDFCFLKKIPKIKRLAAEDPEGLKWWARMEQKTGQVFRRDRFSYTDLAEGRVPLRVLNNEMHSQDEGVCLCTD